MADLIKQEDLGPLLITLIAVLLAFLAIYLHNRLAKQRHDFEKRKWEDEKKARDELTEFRKQEYKRFTRPASDIAEQVSRKLIEDPYWAHQALQAARYLPYRGTLFDDRTQHFKNEKEKLADIFTRFLVRRCKRYSDEKRDVYLYLDAGTTLYPFFGLIGRETAKAWQTDARDWLERFHLITNNLPGLEQFMEKGRQTQYSRYSQLAIGDCQLLPGEPLPIFASVVGPQTEKAINNLPAHVSGDSTDKNSVIIALVVGNWVRIRRTSPRCPVCMARGKGHLGVKQAAIEKADEIFVISPLGKVFVDQSNEDINKALGYIPNTDDPEKDPYEEVTIDNIKAKRIKLVSTTRTPNRGLYEHAIRLESVLGLNIEDTVDEEEFSQLEIERLPHLMLPFHELPHDEYEEFLIEFPHENTRGNKGFLNMFNVKELP